MKSMQISEHVCMYVCICSLTSPPPPLPPLFSHFFICGTQGQNEAVPFCSVLTYMLIDVQE